MNHFARLKTDFARAWGQGRLDHLAAGRPGAATEGGHGRRLVHRYFAAAAEINEKERDLTRAMLQSLTPTEVFQFIGGVPPVAIERGQELGEFSSAVDPAAAAEILTSVYFGTVSIWLVDGPRSYDLAEALAARLDLVLIGLNTR